MYGATGQASWEARMLAEEDARLCEGDFVAELMEDEGMTEDEAWKRLEEMKDAAQAESYEREW